MNADCRFEVARASRPHSVFSALILCGGTGGHLTPGIALAEALAARGHQPILLVSHKQIDARILEKYPHLTFAKIPGTPLSAHPVRLARFLLTQTQAFLSGLRLVRRHRPAIVVGFGGFTTASVILAARLRRIPVALHESNRVPGRAVRHLARLAQRVYLPPGIQLKTTTLKKQLAAGLPTRAEIKKIPRPEACAALGLDPNLKTLVIFGGSQGATALNNWARQHASDLARLNTQLYCVTGPGKESPPPLGAVAPGTAGILPAPSERGLSGAGVSPADDAQRRSIQRSIFVPFCDNVAALLSAADLVIARAGAGTIAELIRCVTPSILVPYPFAADNHQAANAAWLAQHGGALVVPQDQIATELLPAVETLLTDDARRAELAAALRRLDQTRPLDAIIADLETLARR